MPDGFIPFLMLLVITVASGYGGTSTTTERFYVPRETACEEVKALFEADHTWQARRGTTNIYSIAIATCVPMRGVQHMKDQ